MAKLLVFALFAASATGLRITGKNVDLLKDEMYPSGTDGTRLAKVCSGAESDQEFFLFPDAGETIDTIVVGALDSAGLDNENGDFTVLYTPGASSFTVRFRPVTTEMSMRQVAGLVKVQSSEGVFQFGIGSSVFGPQIQLENSGSPGIPVTSIDFGSFAVQGPTRQTLTLVAYGQCAFVPSSTTSVTGKAFSATIDQDQVVVVTFSPVLTSKEQLGVLTVQGADYGITATLFGSFTGDISEDTCTDVTINGEPWHDTFGPVFGCGYYKEFSMCDKDGDAYRAFGYSANEACCTCETGGLYSGDPEPVQCYDWTLPDGELWHDAMDDGCNFYAKNFACATDGGTNGMFGATANQACCACAGGDTGEGYAPLVRPEANCADLLLADGGKWHDAVSTKFTCQWYANNAGTCAFYGTGAPFEEKTATDSCCHCEGGQPCVNALLPDGEPWHDGFVSSSGNLFGCEWYGKNPGTCHNFGHLNPFDGKTANEACCACKGAVLSPPTPEPAPPPYTDPPGCVSAVLENGDPWRDGYVASNGAVYTCEWYALGANRCTQFGTQNPFEGKTASTACCVCQ